MIREGMRRNETRRRVQSAQTTTVTDCSILIRMPGLHRHVGDIRQRPKMPAPFWWSSLYYCRCLQFTRISFNIKRKRWNTANATKVWTICKETKDTPNLITPLGHWTPTFPRFVCCTCCRIHANWNWNLAMSIGWKKNVSLAIGVNGLIVKCHNPKITKGTQNKL